MALVHIDGFRYRAGSDLALDYTVTGSPTVVEMADRRPGCWGVELAGATMRFDYAFAGNKCVIGFVYQRIADAGSGDAGEILQIIDGAGSIVHLTLAVDTDGVFLLYRGDSATGTLIHTGVAAGDSPTFTQLSITVDDVSGSVLWTGEGSGVAYSGDTQNGGTASIGAIKFSGPTSGWRYADLFIIDADSSTGSPTSRYSSTEWPVRVDALLPYQWDEWNDLDEYPSGSYASSTTVDDASGSDGDSTYMYSTTVGHKQMWLFGPMDHDPASVEGARIVLTARKSGTGVREIKHATNIPEAYSGVPWNVLSVESSGTALTTSYAAYSKVWTQPTSQDAFNAQAFGLETAGDVDGATEFRVTQAVAYALSTGTQTRARVTQVVVQTLSDSASSGEARVTQVVVQTLSDAGERAITDNAPADARVGTPLALVAEVTAAIDTDGATETWLFTNSDPWATASTDTPANTVVHHRMTTPANMARDMFGAGTTFGAVAAGYGLCEIANSDGAFDDWADYSFSGQTFVLRAGVPGTAYPTEWTTIIRGTMQAIEADMDRIRIRLRDRIEILQRALLRDTTYADPQVYGQVFNVEAKLIDAANLVYAVGRPPAGKLVGIQSLRDNGVRLTHQSGGTGDYSTVIATEGGVAAATVSSGRWNWNPDSGRLKVGSKPSGVLTATVVVMDDSASWTTIDGGANVKVGTILSQMAQAAGIDGGDIVLGDVNTVDIACGDTPFGFWASGDERVLDGMNAIANSLGVWFGFDRLDQFRMAQFTAPAGDPEWTFTQHNILRNSVRRITTQDPGRGVPVWRVVARSNHCDSPQSSFAGAVAEGDKALMRQEWPVETAVEDSAVLTWCPAATELVLDVYSAATGPTATSGAVQTDDAGEAQRRLSLYSGTAEMVQVDVPATPDLLTSVDIGSVVRLQFPRYGWDDGVLFTVVGVNTR